MISADTVRFRNRPKWTLLAQGDGGRILARALWWGQRDSTHPLALDCLSTADEVPAGDRAELAAGLLGAAHRAFAEAGYRNTEVRLVLSTAAAA